MLVFVDRDQEIPNEHVAPTTDSAEAIDWLVKLMNPGLSVHPEHS